MGDDRFWTADSFNRFISGLSNQYKSEDHRSAARSHSTEHTTNFKSNQNLESITEISNADRNRPIFDRAKHLIDSTKQLVSRAKRLIDSTGQFIKEHFDHLQRSRAGLKRQNQSPEYRERSAASLDFSTENRAFKDRAEQLFGTITANISRTLEDPIANAINESIKSTGFKQRCQRIGEDRIKISSNNHSHTTNRHRESTLENLAIESTEQLLRRFGDAKQADQYAWGNCRKINSVNQQLERLETKVAEIRLKPKPATDFSYLRSDGYYPDYVAYHKEICEKQQQAYNSKNPIQLIDYIQKKSKNIETYMSRASTNLSQWDYEKFEKIIKNDQRMLKYFQCEKILEPQNDHLKQQRESYQSCLKSFETIKSDIYEIKNPSPRQNTSQQTYQPEYKPKPKNDFELDI